jgi:hypothetical protein
VRDLGAMEDWISSHPPAPDRCEAVIQLPDTLLAIQMGIKRFGKQAFDVLNKIFLVGHMNIKGANCIELKLYRNN